MVNREERIMAEAGSESDEVSLEELKALLLEFIRLMSPNLNDEEANRLGNYVFECDDRTGALETRLQWKTELLSMIETVKKS